MSKTVRVTYKHISKLPQGVREANNLPDSGFAEITVKNSEPDIQIEGVESPARRAKESLSEEDVSVDL